MCAIIDAYFILCAHSDSWRTTSDKTTQQQQNKKRPQKEKENYMSIKTAIAVVFSYLFVSKREKARERWVNHFEMTA